MANLNGTIDFLITDNDYTLATALDLSQGEPVEAYFVVKENFWDADADAILTIQVTTTPDDSGSIGTHGVDDATVPCTFYLVPADTHLLSPYFTYVHVIRYKTDDDKYFTQEEGTLVPNPGITALE